MSVRIAKDAYTTLSMFLSDKGIDIHRPFRCLSPTHADTHPSMSYDAKRDRVHCFACGVTYDLVDLVAMEKGCNHGEALSLINSFYGEKLNETNTDGADYWSSRGINEETKARFGLCIENGRAVVPFDCEYIQYRSVWNKYYYNPKGKKIKIFDPENAYGLVIVTEGAIDAISIMQVSEKSCEKEGPCAIAINGVSNIRKLALSAREDSVYCLALDNDESGAAAQERLAALLKRRGVKNFSVNLYGCFKDANERLISDEAGLKRAVMDAWNTYKSATYKKDEAGANKVHIVQKEHITQEEQEEQGAQHLHDADDVQHDLSALEARQVSADISSNLSFLDDVFDDNKNNTHISTGIRALDEIITGLPCPGLTVLGAPAGVGKTTLCLQIADLAAKFGKEVLFITCEMSRNSLIKKSIARESLLLGAKHAVTVNALVQRKDDASVRAAIAQYKKYAGRIHMYEPDTATPGYIEACIKKHVESAGDAPFVVIDYLQLLVSDDAATRIRMTEKENIDRILSALRRLCRKYALPLLAISSMNRAAYSDPLSLSAYKESGAIEYCADLLLSMRAERSCGDSGQAELCVIKNRNGASGGRAGLTYYAEYACFV